MNLFGMKLTPMAIRVVEISQKLTSLTDVMQYHRVRVYVTFRGLMLGSIDIDNNQQPISQARIRRAVADNLALRILDPTSTREGDILWSQEIAAFIDRYLASSDPEITSQFVEHSQLATHPLPTWLIDLSKPLQSLPEAAAFNQVRIIVSWQDRPIGSVDINNQFEPITAYRLRHEIAGALGFKLFEGARELGKSGMWAKSVNELARMYLSADQGQTCTDKQLPAEVPVSVVIATLDRPDDLRDCLRSLQAQESPRTIEIVVVDNNPDSGLTTSVVADFPDVVLLTERRKGLSYARNTGFVASTGDIVLATDDDVLLPPDWLEQLVAPFARQDVMIVTGNVLPYELETQSQQLFEIYGGLGRGFKRFEVSGDWFEMYRLKSVPTWELGATANAAFRASIFHDPDIGMMDESLGAGSPTGCSEDTYAFYKVLKAGFTILYEPQAYVWHKHRRTMAAFRNQLYAYSKGGVAYHMTLFLNDGDWRGLFRIFFELPMGYVWRLNEWLHGRTAYSPSFILLEMRGNVAGFWSLWKSRRRVKKLGRSQPYIPCSLRNKNDQGAGQKNDPINQPLNKITTKRLTKDHVIQLES